MEAVFVPDGSIKFLLVCEVTPNQHSEDYFCNIETLLEYYRDNKVVKSKLENTLTQKDFETSHQVHYIAQVYSAEYAIQIQTPLEG